MKVYNFLQTIPLKKTTLLLGSFECFHQGHKKLYEEAKKLPNPVGIVIFESLNIFDSNRKQITSLKIRLETLAKLGFDFAIVVNFDHAIKSLDGLVFIKKLISTCNVENFVVGRDFKFGNDAKYNATKLKLFFSNTIIVNLAKQDNVKIASSLIRDEIQLGNIESVNQILFQKWRIEGQFENASSFTNQLLPHSGIYYGQINLNEMLYFCLIHIDMLQNIFIKTIPSTNIFKNQPIELIFWKQKRLIINQRFDQIDKKDIDDLQAFAWKNKY